MKKKKRDGASRTEGDSTSQPQTPAVPPPDDPLRRSAEFDPDREYKSRQMAEKRLEAIRKTREMPTTADEESSKRKTDLEEESDPT